jgi:hypothetical protein
MFLRLKTAWRAWREKYRQSQIEGVTASRGSRAESGGYGGSIGSTSSGGGVDGGGGDGGA